MQVIPSPVPGQVLSDVDASHGEGIVDASTWGLWSRRRHAVLAAAAAGKANHAKCVFSQPWKEDETNDGIPQNVTHSTVDQGRTGVPQSIVMDTELVKFGLDNI